MDSRAITFLEKERICVLSVVLADGSPHAATVHYSQQSDPVKIFVQTYPTVKAKAIQAKGGTVPVAMVIGFSEEEFVTLQMRGEVRIVSDPAEQEAIFKIHYAKHPEAEQYRSPRTILLEFVPSWWRYTDFKADPEAIISSEDTVEKNV